MPSPRSLAGPRDDTGGITLTPSRDSGQASPSPIKGEGIRPRGGVGGITLTLTLLKRAGIRP